MEPARLFSTGRQAKSHSPLTAASNASSKLAKPTATPSGANAKAASSLNAPATPWKATRVTDLADMADMADMAVSLQRPAPPASSEPGCASVELLDLAAHGGQLHRQRVE